ncbi:arginine--tRNA ligase, partial [Bacteroidota bacterium]|nr:arginine--tRNA ligase [Bacteroidota bacterium]
FMVEYSSPNTNKPLHLGHLRNIFLGDAVVSLLKSVGHKVVRTQIINDRGIHICKSMVAWTQLGNGETPEISGLKGDHLVGKYYVLFDKIYKKQVASLISSGMNEEEAKNSAQILKDAQEMLIKWEQNDSDVIALWEKMNGWVYNGFERTYQSLNISFDHLYYESNTYKVGKSEVENGLAEKKFYKKEDQSIWCDLSPYKLDDKLLIRSDGTSVYMTQDIGTAIQRFRDYPSLSGVVYTVGNEQNHHFNVLFKILQKLDFEWAKQCHHLSYGMVELPEGKMKSREGSVVDADDLLSSLIDEAKKLTLERGHLEGMNDEEIDDLCHKIGLGGLKYFLLKVDPKKKMFFNPIESIDLNGHTGPFIQYGYARICSLLDKVDDYADFNDDNVQISNKELDVIKTINHFKEIVQLAAKDLSPAILANYLFSLVKTYNSFYQDFPILKESNVDSKSFRLCLSSLTATVLKNGMNILGIELPSRM